MGGAVGVVEGLGSVRPSTSLDDIGFAVVYVVNALDGAEGEVVWSISYYVTVLLVGQVQLEMPSARSNSEVLWPL